MTRPPLPAHGCRDAGLLRRRELYYRRAPEWERAYLVAQERNHCATMRQMHARQKRPARKGQA